MKYLLDSNVLIHFERYTPRDVHPGLWESLEELIDEKRVFLQRECLAELERGSDDLSKWAGNFSGFILESDEAEILRVAQISNTYPGWVQQQQNAADPWLIACAEARDLVLVTDENLKGLNSSPAKMTIPTVIAHSGSAVLCWKSLAMQREEGWRFTRG